MENNITEKREIDVAVISDTHLGTLGCKAEQIHNYLQAIKTNFLVLNGDIVDVWRFSRRYFPSSHMKVIHQIIKMMGEGTMVYYITGNHDEAFRRFVGINFENFALENKVVLNLDGEKTWIFHGDVFDTIMHNSKWLARLGSVGYGLLTGINKTVNTILSLFGKKNYSFAKKIKNKVKGSKDEGATKFEKTVADLAIHKGYKYAICGHIHHPVRKSISMTSGKVTYLNSGDWVENLSALEYKNKEWHLMRWDETRSAVIENTAIEEMFTQSKKDIFLKAVRDVLKS